MLREKLIDKIEKIFAIGLFESNQKQNEILYALKCNSIWSESVWLQKRNFAPGGMAMGW